ncbi:MAG TPA: PAS domain S-box protein, partial [Gemmataceae bacterium]|nr:PAS domain S-box protein [Gemmataceae bacterium]
MTDPRNHGQGGGPAPPGGTPGRPEAPGSLLAYLAEASAVLAASLDYETTLATVARLAVPFLADWCAVDVRQEDGAVRRVAVAHPDPACVELARELERRYPFDPDEPHGLARVLRTGQSEFFPEITDDVLAALARTPEQLAALRQLGLRSAVIVPLVARGRVLGAITLATAESGRRHTADDLAVAEDLGRRCALAVDNARLYREARAAEGRYRDLVDGMDAIVWEADAATWQFTFVSRHAEALLGYPVERWLREPNFWVNLIHPDDRERAVAACREATEQGRDHTFEYRALAADGRVVWLRDLVYVVRDGAGRASRLRGLMVDISDRKQAEDELRDRERYLRAVFDAAMDAFVVTDDQGRYVEVNPAACELFGLPREQLLGRRIADFAEEGFRFDRAWHQFRTRGRDKGEFRLVRPDGTVRHLAYAATADFLPGRHLSVLRDITDRKELEDDLRERALELAEAARQKDDFIAALAHELRNPLGPVRNALQVLRLRPDDRAAVEWARDLADRQIGHLSHLVDDLLDVSR